MNNLKTTEIKKNPFILIVFRRKIECRTIFLKLLQQHVIIISKKVDTNITISGYIFAPLLF